MRIWARIRVWAPALAERGQMQPTPEVRRHFARLRWRVFAILILAYMTVYFHRMAPGVVATDLMQAFQTSGAALGSLAAMYYYIYTAMQIPAGVLADTLGSRVGVALGSVVAGAGSLLFGLAETFEAASLGRVLVGLGVSVVFVGLMRSNTQWFSERRYGSISGLTLFLGNIGSILAAGPLAVLLTATSWPPCSCAAARRTPGCPRCASWRACRPTRSATAIG
jgi:sugar phosphate permease